MEVVKMNEKIKNLKGKLIVSCQALENEPLHSDFIMGRMALAAKMGGASGIRANSVVDIKEIKKQVDLPIIGIIKKDKNSKAKTMKFSSLPAITIRLFLFIANSAIFTSSAVRIKILI